MDSRIDSAEVRDLCAAIAALGDVDDVSRFLEDLCTIREIKDLAQRLQVANMLDSGEPYTTISEKTGASATTIARVSKALNYGAGGYRQVIDMLSDGE
ncbi:MAG: YerC/YecD family TrpR-related protein [Coriobacteriales bacterium]|jgi:TrpR-related protein YerC/YecD